MSSFLETIRSELESKALLYLRVKVMPKSPTNEVVDQLDDGTYKIRITAAPENGKANAELIKFLKKSLAAADVSIVSGQTDRVKLVKVTL